MFTAASAVSFLTFTLLYTPCIAAVAAIRRELNSGIKAAGIVFIQCAVAWAAAFIVFRIGLIIA